MEAVEAGSAATNGLKAKTKAKDDDDEDSKPRDAKGAPDIKIQVFLKKLLLMIQ